MDGANLAAGVSLGPMDIPVVDVRVVGAFAVDVKEGRLPGVESSHYLQVVNLAKGEAIWLPVTKPFLLALARQCNRAAGIPQPVNNDKEY